jgi:hypothetical protein
MMPAVEKASRKVMKKMSEAGWLNPGEEVRIGLVSFPVGYSKGGAEGASTGLVTDLVVVGPLQRKLGRALYGDEDKDIAADLDPERALAVTGMNTMMTVTDQRLLVHEWKGLGKLGDLYAEAPVSECTFVTEDGGKGPAKHRIVLATLPDHRWVMREFPMVGPVGKRADAFVEIVGA